MSKKRTVTYGELTAALRKLNYTRDPDRSAEDHVSFRHRSRRLPIALPVLEDQAPMREIYIAMVRRTIRECSEADAEKAGIVDNDWIEAFNTNGALVARAVVSQRVKEGMCMMYHAQEKIVNVPGSEQTRQRGGIHNSVTRTVLKPTHMIGGYAQQSYGFNYYGTVGSNRDEFVIVRKMADVDWLEGPAADAEAKNSSLEAAE